MGEPLWRQPDTMLHAWGDSSNAPITPTPRADPIPDPGFPEPDVPPGDYSQPPWTDPTPPQTAPDTGFPIDPNTGNNFPTDNTGGGSGGNWWDGLGDTFSGISKDFMSGIGKLWDPKLLMFPAAFASAYKQWQDAQKYQDVAQAAADRSINTAQGASDYSRNTSQGIADLSRGVAGGIAGAARGTAGDVAGFARGDAQNVADFSRGDAAGVAGAARGTAQDAIKYGDPFGVANRTTYQDLLRNAYLHPEDVLNDPAHQATLKSGLDTVARQDASKGYLGSGNMEADLAAYTANENAKYLDSYRAGLVPLTGSQFNPASAGNFLMQGEDLAGRSIMQGNDLAGRSIMQGNDLAGRSLMQGEDLAGRSLMQGEDLAGRSLMTGAGQSGDYLLRGNTEANNALFKGNDQAIASQNAALQALMYPFANSSTTNAINSANGGQGGGGRTNSDPSTDAGLIRAVMSGNKDIINKAIDSGVRFVKLPDGSTADLWAMARSGYQTGAPNDPGMEVGYTPGRDTYGYGSQDPQGPGDIFPPEGPPSWAGGGGSDITPIPDPGFPEPQIPDDWEQNFNDIMGP